MNWIRGDQLIVSFQVPFSAASSFFHAGVCRTSSDHLHISSLLQDTQVGTTYWPKYIACNHHRRQPPTLQQAPSISHILQAIADTALYFPCWQPLHVFFPKPLDWSFIWQGLHLCSSSLYHSCSLSFLHFSLQVAEVQMGLVSVVPLYT